MNIFQRWLYKQAAPLIEDATRQGRLEGLLSSEQWVGAHDFEKGTTLPTDDACGARAAYEHHALFAAAIEVITGLVLGTGLTHSELHDEKANTALVEWFALNELAEFSKAIFKQWLIDGELLLLLASDAGRNEPAWVNLWDVEGNPISVECETGNPRVVTRITASAGATRRVFTPDMFVWRANTIHANNVRGKSPLRAAVQPAVDYTRLMTLRMRAHEIRGRLNAVMKLMAETPEEFHARSSSLGASLPRAGNLLKLHKNPKSGESDEFEFTNLRTDAADAESDTRTLLRTVAMQAALSEHQLAMSDTGNRATAKESAETTARAMEAHQVFLEGVLTELFRKELIRRFGPNETYTVKRSELSADGERTEFTERVPATELRIPLDFPPVRREDEVRLDALRFGWEAELISATTVIEELGFDPALEAERSHNSEEPDS